MSQRDQIPVSMQKTYDRAMSGKSPRNGIKAMCQECMGYDRYEVSLCTDRGCPLYPYRPYRSPAAVKKARQAVEAASGR